MNLAVAGGGVLNLVHWALQAWPEGLHFDRGHTVATLWPLLPLVPILGVDRVSCLPLEGVMALVCIFLFTNKMAYFQTCVGQLGLLS